MKQNNSFNYLLQQNRLLMDIMTNLETGQYICQKLEKTTGKKIKQIKFLHQLGSQKLKDFDIFKNIPDILTLIKTQNNTTIAAYCSSIFRISNESYKVSPQDRAFLISAQNQKFQYYQLNQKYKKVCCYFKNQFAYGNSDLKIKFIPENQKFWFECTNFGIKSASSFETFGIKSEQFIGSKEKKILIQLCGLYQVIFSEEEKIQKVNHTSQILNQDISEQKIQIKSEMDEQNLQTNEPDQTDISKQNQKESQDKMNADQKIQIKVISNNQEKHICQRQDLKTDQQQKQTQQNLRLVQQIIEPQQQKYQETVDLLSESKAKGSIVQQFQQNDQKSQINPIDQNHKEAQQSIVSCEQATENQKINNTIIVQTDIQSYDTKIITNNIQNNHGINPQLTKETEQRKLKELEQKIVEMNIASEQTIKNFELKIQEYKQENQELQNKNSQLQKQVIKLKIRCSEFEAKQKRLLDENEKISTSNRQLKQKLKSNEETLIRNQKIIQTLSNKHTQLLESQLIKDQQVKELKNSIVNLKQEKKLLNSSWQQKIKQEEDKYKILKNQSSAHLLTIKKKQQELLQSSRQIQKLTNSQNQLKELKKQADLKLRKMQIQFDDYKRITELSGSEQRKAYQEKLEYEINVREKAIQILSIEKNNNFENSLFQGRIFQQNSQMKKIMLNLLKQKINKEITATRYLYGYDGINPTSPLEYLRNQEHIVCIIMTQHVVIGAYYSGKVGTPTPQDEGYLFSLTLGEIFEVRNNLNNNVLRPFSSAPDYIMIGNSELRIQKNRLFSNFGIANSYFNPLARRINDFLHEGDNRQVLMQKYEFHCLL